MSYFGQNVAHFIKHETNHLYLEFVYSEWIIFDTFSQIYITKILTTVQQLIYRLCLKLVILEMSEASCTVSQSLYLLFCFVLLIALFKKTFRKVFIDSEVEYGIILFISMFLVTVSSWLFPLLHMKTRKQETSICRLWSW